MLASKAARFPIFEVAAVLRCNVRTRFTTRYLSFETGSVKFFNRRKSYGFIVSDTTGEDVFVHRSGIVGATDENPTNPTLRVGERVKFEAVINERGSKMASQVTFEDGSVVPIFREDFQDRRIVYAKTKLGQRVYDILTEGGDEETIAKRITEAYTAACEEIDAVKEAKSEETAPTV